MRKVADSLRLLLQYGVIEEVVKAQPKAPQPIAGSSSWSQKRSPQKMDCQSRKRAESPRKELTPWLPELVYHSQGKGEPVECDSFR